MLKNFNVKKSVPICLGLVILLTFTFFTVSPYATNARIITIKSDAFIKEVIRLTNVERTNRGLAPLVENESLFKLAFLKSQDMAVNKYFEHKSPVYGYPKEMMQRFNIKYDWLGENIGKTNSMTNTTPERLVKAWMESSTHRDNILNPNFTIVGVAYVKNSDGKLLWTQLFMKP